MSKYEEYIELSEVISQSEQFIAQLKTAEKDQITLGLVHFAVEELNEFKTEQHKPPSFLVNMINQMIKSNCLELTQVALSNLQEQLDSVAIEAKREARAILDKLNGEKSPVAQPSSKINTNTPKLQQTKKKSSKTISKIAPGTKFNHFEVIRFAPEKTKNKQVYECRCVCGNVKYIDKYTLPNRFSCGCKNKNNETQNDVKVAEQPKKSTLNIANISPGKNSRERIEAIKEKKALEAELSDVYD